MITITLPDNSTRQYEDTVTGEEIAKSIGQKLAKDALAIKVNDNLQDLYLPINHDAKISIITHKDPEGLEIIRHDCAHILAEAVKEVFPDCQITIGPVIENGFYYDIYREKSITLDDFPKIEKAMNNIIERNEPIRREEWDRNEAIKFFESTGEQYKAEIIRDLPTNEPISVYKQGNFIDLCRGPHATSTGYPKAFKLMKLAGAYWRGDSKNPMLQRIYATAWPDAKQLQSYLTQLEEAEKRDHRKIAITMDLFHQQEEAPGMIFWHPNGWTIYTVIEQYIRNKLTKNDYKEIKTPILLDKSLWEKSGHWDKFRENMYAFEVDDKIMATKPMSCPCHIKIFNHSLRSYRELPLRFAEFGTCHRHEASGAVHGLLRVRCMNQDDGHIFCTEDQIIDETVKFCNLLREVYADFGFDEIILKLADRPDKRHGTDEVWDKAEKALQEGATAAGMDYIIAKGEGAFYGPKLEFHLRDAIGRTWQCGTWQVDFVLPERLEAVYIGQDGKKHTPVMLHRAILGTLERFMGVLIEQYAGKFPLWLAPVQISVLAITSEVDDYAKSLYNLLKEHNIRVNLDIENEKIQYKIRSHFTHNIPILAIVGKQEAGTETVNLRKLGSDQQETMSITELIEFLKENTKVPL